MRCGVNPVADVPRKIVSQLVGDFECIDSYLNRNAPFELSSSFAIIDFFGSFDLHEEAIVAGPIDQRSGCLKLRPFEHGDVVVGAAAGNAFQIRQAGV